MYRHSFYILVGLLGIAWSNSSCEVAAQSPTPVAKDAFVKEVLPLLTKHCLACHGPDTQEGGVSYSNLPNDQSALRRRPLWKRAVTRVKSDEMPPEGETALSAEEKQKLVAWMDFASEYLNCNDAQRDPGPAVLRRLNRTEYDLTIRDLLGIEFKSAEAVGMPEEAVVDGFDNTASALGFSPTLMEKYLSAADRVIEQLYAKINEPLLPPRKPDQQPKLQPGMSRERIDSRQALADFLFVRPSEMLTEQQAARQIAERFARRAYRGPISAEELRPLAAIYTKSRASGASFELAIKAMMKPVLISPRFLFRIEQGEATEKNALVARVTNHELAVRLSYFLWSSMPDDELFALAEQGELWKPEVLAAQTKRMLASPKARSLTDNFAIQWLQLAKLDRARPTTEFYPTFTNSLRQAMKQETTTFFDKLREEDRSVLELLAADYTYVNSELAKHYGLPEVNGNELQRVALRGEDHRGGLLGMASVLTLTSHTFRTSPTQRGKYLLEVVFGTPPPPPPANVSTLKDDEKNKNRPPATFREQLAQHASQKSCAACHKKLDPLGFALDNYNPIGAWRESQPDSPLDTTGVLPTGEKFNGAAELKLLILRRKDDFSRNFASRMLVYALGRELDYYDDCTVFELGQRLQQHDYKFSALVLGIVESYSFQHRRLENEVNESKVEN